MHVLMTLVSMLSRWVSQIPEVLVSPNKRVVGMLASAETIDVLADALQCHGRPVSVVDPVSTKFILWFYALDLLTNVWVYTESLELTTVGDCDTGQVIGQAC